MGTLSDMGAAIVASRRAAGITQAELGSRVGASQQQVARWESRAYQNVDLQRVSEVAEALGLGADDLAAGVPIAAEPRVAYRPADPTVTLSEATLLLKAFFAARDDVVAAWVFGSVAAGTAGPLSDVDVAVLPRPGLGVDRRWELRLDLAARLPAVFGGRDADVLVVPDAAPLMLHRALVHGVRVHGGGDRGAAEAEIAAAASHEDFRPVLRMKEARLRERLRGHGENR